MLIASSNDVIHPVIPQIFIPFYVHLFLYFLGGGGGGEIWGTVINTKLIENYEIHMHIYLLFSK